ncbi:MAG: hypothetical protein ABJL57_14120 [Hyphomonas sp.]|uniref:hypothetical protein n=1 Tax=Hyphomonas sp. TaxID=87 RepID=UPI003266C55D
MDSLFAPPPPLKPHLQPFRFWIWLQLVLLRLYVRRLKGRGTPFLTMCDARGNVWIAAVGDTPGTARPDLLAFTPSKAFQVAMGCVSPSGMGLEIARLAGYVLRAGLPCAGGLQGQGTDVPLPLPDT